MSLNQHFERRAALTSHFKLVKICSPVTDHGKKFLAVADETRYVIVLENMYSLYYVGIGTLIFTLPY